MQKQPVILQVLPALRSGGVERGTIEVARAIAEWGGVAMVASEGGPMQSALAHAKGKHATLPLGSKNPFIMWKNAHRLARLVKEYNIDIIHARSRAPAWSAYYAAKESGCHFMTTFHGTYGLQNKWKRKYNAIMTRGERVIAISNFIADHIRREYSMDESKLRIIPRGVDLKLFTPSNHTPMRMIALAQEWRLPDSAPPVILFPGRITRWKGQDVFIRALGRLHHRRFFAVILGDNKNHSDYQRELESLIKELHLEGHVRIAKHTPHMVEAYSLDKVVVATSIKPEAFGRVVLEAQAMGKPVIATNQGGPNETVIANETGLLIPPGNATALAGAIDYMLGLDNTTLAAISRQAMQNAENFSITSMCQKTLNVYEELLVTS